MKIVSNTFQQLKETFASNKKELWVIVALTLVTLIIFTPAYARQVYVMQNDYSGHIQFTQLFLNHQFREIPLAVYDHPLYQFLLIFLYLLTLRRVGLFSLALIIQIAVSIIMVLAIYGWLDKPRKFKWNWLRAFLAASLPLVAPIMLFAFWDKLWYLGYIGLENFHNPTIILLRPVAFASFILSLRIFSSKKSSWGMILLAAVLIISSGLIKPNFALCILPAIGIMLIYQLASRRPVEWRLLIFGFFLPGGLLLLGQWFLTYFIPGQAGDKIVIDFLGVMKVYSANLLPKLFLSILFPLTVLVVNFKKVVQRNEMTLAWIGLLISFFEMYCLAEVGERYSDGNFLWGAQIMLFIVFITSVRFLWQEKVILHNPIRWKDFLVFSFYFLHLFAGIAYNVYAIIITTKSPF
jgi:hypothetical protein